MDVPSNRNKKDLHISLSEIHSEINGNEFSEICAMILHSVNLWQYGPYEKLMDPQTGHVGTAHQSSVARV